MKTAFTVTLDQKSFSITDIQNINFNLVDRSKVTLSIKTENNGDFYYEAPLSESDKVNALIALKTDLTSTLKLIAENNLSVE
jgi:hypothetical protein